MTAHMPDLDAYVDALRVGDLFADDTYQRDLDPRRVAKMAAAFDRRLIGVIDVSARTDGRYAILDGQHRHAVVMQAGAQGPDTAVACQIYTGLTLEAEASLFHELNARRKALSFWDRWKSRRASGEPQVLAIEATLARHGLQVHPAAADGNISATKALDVIVADIGDIHLLDSVVMLLTAAFGHTREAFEGGLLQGLALVLTAYDQDEIDLDRLIGQLRDVPARNMKARASAMREVHRGTFPRLFAAAIVEQYNRGRGPRLPSFFARMPEGSQPRAVAEQRRATLAAATPTVTPAATPPTPPATVPAPARPAPLSPMMAVCSCGHTARRHEESDGICLVGECECAAYVGPTS